MRLKLFDTEFTVSNSGLTFPEESYGLYGLWPGLLDGASSKSMNGNFYRDEIFSGKFYRG